MSRTPTLPWTKTGEYMTVGWDIPTRWGIDSAGELFMNDSHGGDPDHPVKYENLLKDIPKQRDRERLAAACGQPTPPPVWAEEALALGWTPPGGGA